MGLPIEYVHRPGLDHDPSHAQNNTRAAHLGAGSACRKAVEEQLRCSLPE